MSLECVSGWLLLDKPEGLSSCKALIPIKPFYGVRRVGHAGTLDPFAKGLLLVFVGRATRLIPHTKEWTKTYRFRVRWGSETTTDDLTGEPTATSSVEHPEKEVIEKALEAFKGDILQVPPAFSALKVGGQRAYHLARKGTEVDLAARKQHVHAFKLLACGKEGALFEVVVNTGTYVRSLARDLGRSLGCLAHVTFLERTGIGRFLHKDALSIDCFEKKGHDRDNLKGYLRPCHQLLDDIPALEISCGEVDQVAQGRPVVLARQDLSGFVFLIKKEKCVAFCLAEKGVCAPKILLM